MLVRHGRRLYDSLPQANSSLDRALRDSVLLAEALDGPSSHASTTGFHLRSSFRVRGTYRSHVVHGERLVTSSFLSTVPHVVTMRPEEEVARVHARGIVTPMEDARRTVVVAGWDRSVVQLPANSGRRDVPLLSILVGDDKLTVSARTDRGCPWPALSRVSSVDLLPKPLLQGLPSSSPTVREPDTLLRAELSWTNDPRRERKRLSARAAQRRGQLHSSIVQRRLYS